MRSSFGKNKMKPTYFLAVVLAVAAILGCSKPPASDNMHQTVMRISVFKDGRISIDGKTLSAEEAEKYIASKENTETMVYYYREAGQEEPHPNAIQIITAVADARLPISLSTKPDFSDFVDENGLSQPRK